MFSRRVAENIEPLSQLSHRAFRRGLRPLRECNSVAFHGKGDMICVIGGADISCPWNFVPLKLRALETSCPSMFFVDKKVYVECGKRNVRKKAPTRISIEPVVVLTLLLIWWSNSINTIGKKCTGFQSSFAHPTLQGHEKALSYRSNIFYIKKMFCRRC